MWFVTEVECVRDSLLSAQTRMSAWALVLNREGYWGGIPEGTLSLGSC